MAVGDKNGGSWTLLTGHGHVLVAIARNPQARVSELAEEAGLTERAVLGIVGDLEAAGYITRHRHGRRTTYTVYDDRDFRHRAQQGLRVGPMLAILAQSQDQPAAPGSDATATADGREAPEDRETGEGEPPREPQEAGEIRAGQSAARSHRGPANATRPHLTGGGRGRSAGR